MCRYSSLSKMTRSIFQKRCRCTTSNIAFLPSTEQYQKFTTYLKFFLLQDAINKYLTLLYDIKYKNQKKNPARFFLLCQRQPQNTCKTVTGGSTESRNKDLPQLLEALQFSDQSKHPILKNFLQRLQHIPATISSQSWQENTKQFSKTLTTWRIREKNEWWDGM